MAPKGKPPTTAALAKAGGSSATVLIRGFLAINLALSILV